MRVAVLTATRDRLDYTKQCFESLRENAGCEYDHYAWDNGSSDGTPEWLETQPLHVNVSGENVGISRAMNELLRIVERETLPPYEPYDVIVKFDNDCEITTPDTLADIAYLTHTYGLLLSPVIHGLRHPPATLGRPISLGGQLVDEKAQIGGIFLAAPADLYESFRYSESNPLWGGDDVEVCAYHRSRGGQCGYVRDYHANHYLSTDGQADDDPVYYARKTREMAGRP